jgi:hypothetical protein
MKEKKSRENQRVEQNIAKSHNLIIEEKNINRFSAFFTPNICIYMCQHSHALFFYFPKRISIQIKISIYGLCINERTCTYSYEQCYEVLRGVRGCSELSVFTYCHLDCYPLCVISTLIVSIRVLVSHPLDRLLTHWPPQSISLLSALELLLN